MSKRRVSPPKSMLSAPASISSCTPLPRRGVLIVPLPVILAGVGQRRVNLCKKHVRTWGDRLRRPTPAQRPPCRGSPPLVVVPAQHLECFANRHREPRVEDATRGITEDILGDQPAKGDHCSKARSAPGRSRSARPSTGSVGCSGCKKPPPSSTGCTTVCRKVASLKASAS